ncbi:hypothetical protein BD626DRAFT_203679 [Schizophyllum amplum]|uniref:Uncharacterized protein n=1 Tax=Schizophyllum amplum TaxID=97359 RepID=A0A550BZM4_9AGAR|nr:hypothetical protein BD626DRAFT_203679 [Auriculariopsis ampla]
MPYYHPPLILDDEAIRSDRSLGWYNHDTAGDFRFPFGNNVGRRVNEVPEWYLVWVQRHLRYRTGATEIYDAVKSYVDGMQDCADEWFAEFIIPCGAQHRGKTLRRCGDRKWLSWVIQRSWLRQNCPLFVEAVGIWLKSKTGFKAAANRSTFLPPSQYRIDLRDSMPDDEVVSSDGEEEDEDISEDNVTITREHAFEGDLEEEDEAPDQDASVSDAEDHRSSQAASSYDRQSSTEGFIVDDSVLEASTDDEAFAELERADPSLKNHRKRPRSSRGAPSENDVQKRGRLSLSQRSRRVLPPSSPSGSSPGPDSPSPDSPSPDPSGSPNPQRIPTPDDTPPPSQRTRARTQAVQEPESARPRTRAQTAVDSPTTTPAWTSSASQKPLRTYASLRKRRMQAARIAQLVDSPSDTSNSDEDLPAAQGRTSASNDDDAPPVKGKKHLVLSHVEISVPPSQRRSTKGFTSPDEKPPLDNDSSDDDHASVPAHTHQAVKQQHRPRLVLDYVEISTPPRNRTTIKTDPSDSDSRPAASSSAHAGRPSRRAMGAGSDPASSRPPTKTRQKEDAERVPLDMVEVKVLRSSARLTHSTAIVSTSLTRSTPPGSGAQASPERRQASPDTEPRPSPDARSRASPSPQPSISSQSLPGPRRSSRLIVPSSNKRRPASPAGEPRESKRVRTTENQASSSKDDGVERRANTVRTTSAGAPTRSAGVHTGAKGSSGATSEPSGPTASGSIVASSTRTKVALLSKLAPGPSSMAASSPKLEYRSSSQTTTTADRTTTVETITLTITRISSRKTISSGNDEANISEASASNGPPAKTAVQSSEAGTSSLKKDNSSSKAAGSSSKANGLPSKARRGGPSDALSEQPAPAVSSSSTPSTSSTTVIASSTTITPRSGTVAPSSGLRTEITSAIAPSSSRATILRPSALSSRPSTSTAVPSVRPSASVRFSTSAAGPSTASRDPSALPLAPKRRNKRSILAAVMRGEVEQRPRSLTPEGEWEWYQDDNDRLVKRPVTKKQEEDEDKPDVHLEKQKKDEGKREDEDTGKRRRGTGKRGEDLEKPEEEDADTRALSPLMIDVISSDEEQEVADQPVAGQDIVAGGNTAEVDVANQEVPETDEEAVRRERKKERKRLRREQKEQDAREEQERAEQERSATLVKKEKKRVKREKKERDERAREADQEQPSQGEPAPVEIQKASGKSGGSKSAKGKGQVKVKVKGEQHAPLRHWNSRLAARMRGEIPPEERPAAYDEREWEGKKWILVQGDDDRLYRKVVE